MNIINIYNRNVIVADQNSDVLTAAQLMRQHHVGTIVIVADAVNSKKPIGIVSERDLVVKVLAKNVSAKDITLHDTMTRDLVCLREDDDIIDTIRVMCMEGVRRAPVINKQGNLVGILAMDDLVEMLADDLSNLARLIERGRQNEKRIQCSQ